MVLSVFCDSLLVQCLTKLLVSQIYFPLSTITILKSRPTKALMYRIVNLFLLFLFPHFPTFPDASNWHLAHNLEFSGAIWSINIYYLYLPFIKWSKAPYWIGLNTIHKEQRFPKRTGFYLKSMSTVPTLLDNLSSSWQQWSEGKLIICTVVLHF